MHLTPLSSRAAGDKSQPELRKPGIFSSPFSSVSVTGKEIYGSDPGIGTGRISEFR